MFDTPIEGLTLLEGLNSTPARRYLSSDPIPETVLWNILDTAIRGPSGGNNQGWGWLIVRDQEIKNRISQWYLEGWNKAYGVRKSEILHGTDSNDTLGKKNFQSAEHLANHIQDAPVWIFAVLRSSASNNPRLGASIYGAVQNLMLAARAYGIGSTLTTLYSGYEADVKNLLDIPKDFTTMALIPLGYPVRGKWGRPKRQLGEDVTHWESWSEKQKRPTLD